MLGRALGIAAGACLLLAGNAGASSITVTYEEDVYCGGFYRVLTTFAAASGEINRLTIGTSEEDTINESGVPGMFGGDTGGTGCFTTAPKVTSELLINDGSSDIKSAPNCGRLRPRLVLCGFAPKVRFYLGDQDDRLQLSVYDIGIMVDAGPGNDYLRTAGNLRTDTVYCGTGVDTVVADPGDVTDAACESVTRLPA